MVCENEQVVSISTVPDTEKATEVRQLDMQGDSKISLPAHKRSTPHVAKAKVNELEHVAVLQLPSTKVVNRFVLQTENVDVSYSSKGNYVGMGIANKHVGETASSNIAFSGMVDNV